jgi:hypothetical protein
MRPASASRPNVFKRHGSTQAVASRSYAGLIPANLMTLAHAPGVYSAACACYRRGAVHGFRGAGSTGSLRIGTQKPKASIQGRPAFVTRTNKRCGQAPMPVRPPSDVASSLRASAASDVSSFGCQRRGSSRPNARAPVRSSYENPQAPCRGA